MKASDIVQEFGPSFAEVPDVFGVFVARVVSVLPVAEVEDILQSMEVVIESELQAEDGEVKMIVTPAAMAFYTRNIMQRLSIMQAAVTGRANENAPVGILAADGNPA